MADTSNNPKPAPVAPSGAADDAHRRTTQLVRESLLAGVRYGTHGLSREGTR